MLRITSARVALSAAAIAAVALSGCGGDSYDGFHVSGNVTFNGTPVPAGKIYFTPDRSKGNSGVPGYANIVDGKYDTASEGGKPPQGGAMVVGIEGFDPNAKGAQDENDTSGEQVVKTLFPLYETAAELTEVNSTKDFDVPAAAAARKDQAERPQRGGP